MVTANRIIFYVVDILKEYFSLEEREKHYYLDNYYYYILHGMEKQDASKAWSKAPHTLHSIQKDETLYPSAERPSKEGYTATSMKNLPSSKGKNTASMNLTNQFWAQACQLVKQR